MTITEATETIQLDFALNEANGETIEGALAEALAEYGVAGEVVGQANGWPVVALTGTREQLEVYVIMYCGGDTGDAATLCPWLETEDDY